MSSENDPISICKPLVICLCACSFDHPEQPGICDATKPAAIVELARPSDWRQRIPMCERCAIAHGAPLLTNDTGGE